MISKTEHKIILKLVLKASLLTVLFFSCGNLFAQNTPLTVLPFELKTDNRIYIKCRINEADELSFMFDTGANGSVINQSILGKKLDLNLDGESNNVGANGSGKVAVSNRNTISFGDVKISDASFVVIPYGEAPFDGVFGSDIMQKYVIEIDYNKKQLRFYNPEKYLYQTADYERYKLRKKSGLMVIEGAVNAARKKYKGYFEIDTGGDGGLSLTSPFVEKYQFNKSFKTVAKATVLGSDGTSVQSPIVVLPEVRIGSKYFYRVPTVLSASQSGVFADREIDGIFGNNFLKRFNAILDISRNQIFLKANDLLHTPYYDFLVDKIQPRKAN